LTTNTTKSVMLAAVTALNLGVGSAMAQSESNGEDGREADTAAAKRPRLSAEVPEE
jgi:hypothetical protein